MGTFVDRTGEIRTASNGMKMTVIKGDNGHDNLIIQFEDGVVVGPCRWEFFDIGYISHPTIKPLYQQTRNKNGIVSISKQGQYMIIIDSSRGYHDLTIQFEDGTIKEHVRFNNFEKGEVLNENLPIINKANINALEKARTKWLGQQRRAKCGLMMIIIDYDTAAKVTIRFESGAIVHKSCYNFDSGMVRHPFPYQVGNIIMKKRAYVHNDIGNFYCKCLECGHEDIWDITEIKNHVCNF
ncbi:MAG: hypothetical protein IJZ79_03290 [Bacilli bacterium]|nr:hypothetical protein [Bacilli bacterium]MBQ8218752.1 hypothetical protein [Bacilli bacterium]